jgi:hypothetical protein
MNNPNRDPQASGVRFRQLPPIMLVRVPEDVEAQLELSSLAVRVLRVRHPLPACHRAHITRPSVIVIGGGVRSVDADLLSTEAVRIRAAVLDMSWVPAKTVAARLRTLILSFSGGARCGNE